MEPKPWYKLNENELLEKRISELPLTIEHTGIETLIKRLYGELLERGLIFAPPCFLAEEWFCPVGVPAIGVPFYLAHSRLRNIEQKFILEVEGGAKKEFMKLIRHEAGHAYSYAYNLYKKKEWQRLFGLASEEYPDTYRPRPYSRSYVVHLDNWYAQSHPDEDFAETFAIWLTPNLNWRKRFKGWKALEKLEYVDKIMRQIAGKPAVVQSPAKLASYSGLNKKLKTYLKFKSKLYEECYPDFYDKDLKNLFTDADEEKSGTKAASYLKGNRLKIIRACSFWTKEKKITIDQLVKRLIDRCSELNLYVKKECPDLDLQIAAYISTLVSHYLFTGKFKRSK